MRSKLDSTTDFIDLFTYIAGEWTTPVQFHQWAALSLIAACVEDRVFLPFADHAETHANLWVFLIGPSGTGKDHAIRLALSLLKPEDPIWKIDGKVTMPALYDHLHARQKAAGRDSAPIYLVSSDITEQLPLGPEAKDFTSRALSLYDRHDRAMMDLTRTSGDKVVHRPLMNWIAGCTPDWFPLAIDPLVFSSGFAGRAFFIFGEPNNDYWHLESPTRRFDHDLVMDHLRRRVEAYQQVEGVFVMTEPAQVAFQMWRLQQQEKLKNSNFSDVEKGVINRMRASVKKLAMLFALSRWTGGLLVIKGSHMSRAITTVESVFDGVKKVADFAYINVDTQAFEKVATLIQSAGSIHRTALRRAASKRGVVNRKQFDEIIESLKEMGHITVDKQKPTKPGGPWPQVFVWKKRVVRGLKEGTNGEANSSVTQEPLVEHEEAHEGVLDLQPSESESD